MDLASEGGKAAEVTKGQLGVTRSISRDSATVAGWTLVSRVTGFARVVAVAAVLGPTFLGNIFQAVNLLPNLAYELLVGSLIGPLLVPALVAHNDRGEDSSAARVAGSFLGIVLGSFVLVTAGVVLAGPFVLRLLSFGIEDPAVAAEQQAAGRLLLVLVMPQLVLYGIAGTAGAAMNAVGRFALPAAVPALENLGVIATVMAVAIRYGSGIELGEAGNGQLVLLGAGSTAAVAVHATVLWWGTYRAGIVLYPRMGWRAPEVRGILALAVPGLGFAALSAVREFGLVVAANGIRGGVVAFQTALNLLHLPVALAARPVSVALLPRISRRYQEGDTSRYRDECVGAVRLVAFFTVPAAVAYVVLAWPVARALAYGEMATPVGVSLLAASVASLGPGVVGESGFVLGTSTAYARRDARSPLLAMVVRVAVALVGILLALLMMPSRAVLIVLGLAVSLGNLLGVAHLGASFARQLPAGRERLLPALLRALLASLLAVSLAYLAVAQIGGRMNGRLADLLALGLASMLGVLSYTAAQTALGSPELRSLINQLRAWRSSP